MSEEYDSIRNVPDNRFPNFLFNPIRNVFENDIYDKTFDESNPAVIRAHSIRGKTKNLDRYLSDVEAYDNYMHYLAETEAGGDIHLLENFISSDEDENTFYLPIKPRLKKNSPAYEMLKLGIRPSVRTELPDYDEIIEFTEAQNPALQHIDERVPYDPTKRPSKEIRKEVRKVFETAARNNRIRGLYSGESVNDSLELLRGFISNYGATAYDAEGAKYGELSISEMIKMESNEKYDIGINKDPLDTKVKVAHNGRIVSNREERNLEIMKILYQASGIETAFDVSKGKGMRKSAVKLAMREVGIVDPVGKDDVKKFKKKEKKRKQMLQANLRGNQEIARTLSRNRFNFDDNDDILAMNLGELFRGK